jgi:hypothetical protein
MRSKLIAGLIMVLAALPCPGQGYDWAAKENGIFPIGWTSDGACFAYGTFDYSMMISNQSRLNVAVQNMKTDKVLWQHGRSWDEGNAGDGSGDILPRSASEAWSREKNRIDPKLAQFKIVTGGPGSPAKFPITNGDSLGVKIIELRSENYRDSFQVKAVSRNLGSKTICQAEKASPGNDLVLLGYFPSPDGMRIAVIIEERGCNFPYPSYHVIGCSTKSGFKKQ